MPTVRTARPTDIEALLDVGRAAWRATFEPLAGAAYVEAGLARWWTPEAVRADVEAGRVLLAEDGDDVQGMALATAGPGRTTEVRRLYVAPRWQGRGVGSALLTAVVAATGADRDLELTVLETNHHARRFYARHGFRPTGPRGDPHGGPPLLHMIRTLHHPRSNAMPTTTLRHTVPATPEQVWQRWTTPGGIETWWAPDGFAVTVQELDLRPGGALVYTMTATGAEQIAFMESAGMPLATVSRKTFTEVTPTSRLAYTSLVDFVPGHEPYEFLTVVTLTATTDGTEVVMEVEPLHDDVWTGRLVQGRENELANLERVLSQGATAS